MRSFLRIFLCLIALAAISGISLQETSAQERLGSPRPFSFERLIDEARAASERPYDPAPARAAEVLERIDYDAHWKIRFRPEKSEEIAPGVPLQFFHMGRYFKEPVRLYEIGDGQAREILYHETYFDMPEDSPAHELPDDIGFAGFRIMRPDLKTDWISFLGASYFRTDGQSRQYGQSARGLALNTGTGQPEEFPRFSSFWFQRPAEPSDDVIVYAMLDSPSVTGAYKMTLQNEDGKGQVIDVDSHLFFRQPVERLGIAPLTSMYWYSETNRSKGRDWRPEVHDTDGLAMITEGGEHIWRPLNNPASVRTSTFLADNVQGFGLAQRDRSFDHYQDDGVFYDKRPSVWIEPLDPFGKGAVQLVEIPTDDEIYDNIVAYFIPADLPKAGSQRHFKYRMHWQDAHPLPDAGARVVSTYIGMGGVPGQPRPQDQIKVVVDFAGPSLAGKTREDSKVEAVVELSEGNPIKAYALPVVGTDRWRLSFDAKVKDQEPIEARAFLKEGDETLTETWLGQLSHEQVAK